MTLFIPAYLAGVLTILSPCILPIVPFVLARANQPFVRGSLPMLAGLAIAFAAVASLAAVAGGWAVEANQFGRAAALTLMAIFGFSLIFPSIASRLTAPLVAAGSRMAAWAQSGPSTVFTSIALGVATGLLWTPCAGPILGLILSGAALSGPGPQTSALLLAYALGAATSLAIAMLVSRQILARVRPSLRWIERARQVTGVAVIAGAATLGLGLDGNALQRLSAERTYAVENMLVKTFANSLGRLASPAEAAMPNAISGSLGSLLDQQTWINTSPLRAEDLRGKVVVVNFWTYSCINCLRSLPHVKAWAQTYKDQGLVVVGVHAPEFAFERDPDNVARAVASLGVRHPVVLDNEFRIWRGFNNGGWPAVYVIGTDGRIRHQAIGEGRHEQTERVIRKLLAETNDTGNSRTSQQVNGQGTQKEADWANLRSPETYLGYDKAERFASPGRTVEGTAGVYKHPAALAPNFWSLSGNWTIGPESAALNAAGGTIRYRFHARDLHLVLVPNASNQPVRFRVRIDGAAPGANHGSDVDDQGFGVVKEGKLYQLARQTGPVMDRTLEIEFLDPGVRAYAFTFG